jgi:hypothetical protein
MLDEQLVTVAEVPVWRGRADAGHAGGIGEGEAGRRPSCADQVEGGLQQRLLEVAVVIAALGCGALVLAASSCE